MIEKELPDFESQAALFLKIIPSRQVETRSKLFCIDCLIPFGFI